MGSSWGNYSSRRQIKVELAKWVNRQSFKVETIRERSKIERSMEACQLFNNPQTITKVLKNIFILPFTMIRIQDFSRCSTKNTMFLFITAQRNVAQRLQNSYSKLQQRSQNLRFQSRQRRRGLMSKMSRIRNKKTCNFGWTKYLFLNAYPLQEHLMNEAQIKDLSKDFLKAKKMATPVIYIRHFYFERFIPLS